LICQSNSEERNTNVMLSRNPSLRKQESAVSDGDLSEITLATDAKDQRNQQGVIASPDTGEF
jgi:hypothetical protein